MKTCVCGLFCLLLVVCASAARGELVLKARGGTEERSAPLVSTDVRIRVTAHVARTKVTQRFENPHADWYEGIYVFPLPEKSAVDRLRIRIGERLIEGEIREKGEARATYAQAKAEGRRASLVDQERPNIFTTRVANIGPGEEVQVEIEYQQTLAYDQGHYLLRFPMVVGPRYLPAGMAEHDAASISPPVLHPAERTRLHNPVSLRVDLQAGVPIARISSPSHPVEVSCQRAGCVASLRGPVPATKDFVLEWTLAQGAKPAAAAIAERDGERYYGLVMVVPPLAEQPAQRLPREAIFVIDTSGSMQGASIAQATEALELALRRLSPADRFNVIEFNDHARALYREARSATPGNVQAAVHWVRQLQARGGTEMAKALDLALDARETPGRVRQIVFLTDGAVGNEDQLFRLIGEGLGDSRLFTVGIGSAPNSHFMAKAAQIGLGSFTYIGRIGEVKEKMDALFAKLESPVLKGVRVDWGDAAGVAAWPRRIPDLYAGEPVMVSFSAERLPGAITISALAGERSWQTLVPVTSAIGENSLAVLWARDEIAALMDRLREGAPEREIRAAVLKVALEHKLVSRYTSLVAVDKTPARTAEALLKSAAIATNLPEGWTYEGVFGVPGELPRGATSLRFDLLLGGFLLFLATVLWRRRRG